MFKIIIFLFAFSSLAEGQIKLTTSLSVDSMVKHFSCGQEKYVIDFEVTNTGNYPLVFCNCKTSCGCYVADCPKEPVAPGEKTIIRTRFMAKGRSGAQHKTLTLHCNTEPEHTVLRIKGVVRAQ